VEDDMSGEETTREESGAPEAEATTASLGIASVGRTSPPHRDLVGRAFGEVVSALFGVSSTKIGDALDIQAQKGGRIGEILVGMKVLLPHQVHEAIAVQLDLPYLLDIDADQVPDELVRAVPIGFAKQNKLLPLGKTDDGVVIVVSADPLDSAALDDLRALLMAELEIAVTAPDIVMAAINSAYDRATQLAENAVAGLEDGAGTAIDAGIDEEIVDLLDIDGDDEAPIIRLVNSLLSQAVKQRASDIHIEPFERDMSVRFRIDGVLIEVIKPPKRFKDAITSRVKIMAGLNIAEKRLPQDGRIRLKVAGRDIDIRVSSVPTTYGERIVMRLLDRSSVLRDLDTIGFSKRNLNIMNALINKSHGIVLVTGPTGSGKTSTLYGCLAKINKPDLNILTIEDPVEYQLKGIGQVQVNAKIDLTFANGLRSFLRQDPDVIMVGEIRDRETAEIAIQASLTGHLVMSTVHTNDAAGAISRLVDMGVEPFLVASSLIGVLAQRLVRTICPNCKVPYTPTREELLEIGIKPETVTTLLKGVGCKTCGGKGYLGRIGIYELMLVDDEIRQLVLKNVDAQSIKSAAREKGMHTLQMDGADKVLAGITTIEEVTRVTQEDSIVVPELE